MTSYRFQPGDHVEVFTANAPVPPKWHPARVTHIAVSDFTVRVTVEGQDVDTDLFFHADVVLMATNEALDQYRLRHIPQQGMCTCHHPPRPIQRNHNREEWGHTDEPDGEPTAAETFHVHAESHSRDCDGPLDRSSTYQMTSITDCESKDDLWRELCRLEMSAHAIKQEITIDGENHTAEFAETTDEGYRNMFLRGCEDTECAHEGSSQRDYYAEAMGY